MAVEILLKNGSNPNTFNKFYSRSALQAAFSQSNVSIHNFQMSIKKMNNKMLKWMFRRLSTVGRRNNRFINRTWSRCECSNSHSQQLNRNEKMSLNF